MGLLTTIAFIRRGIHSGLCSPDIADFRDLYFFSEKQLFIKIKVELVLRTLLSIYRSQWPTSTVRWPISAN